MPAANQSILELALLGLVRLRQPCSGYDLRQLFVQTPMRTFSDSPGSIYPALKRLERSKLVRSQLETSSLVRRRKLFRLTANGRQALVRWLAKPIDPKDMVRGMPELFLRFAFLEDCLGRQSCIRFLMALLDALRVYVATLHEHLESHQSKMSLSARLALQSGIMGYESQAAWAQMALKKYRQTRNT